MRPLFEKIPFAERSSYLIRQFSQPYIDAPWHYHPEYELTYIISGNGKRFVGDSIEDFGAGDLILLGSNLPHFWRCEQEYYDKSNLNSEWLVIQLPQEFLGHSKVAPEFQGIVNLLKTSQRGINFGRKISQEAYYLMQQIENQHQACDLIKLLSLLDLLHTDSEKRLLATESYEITANDADTERMKRILEHVLENFRQEIRLETVADIAHLTPAAFCRYFKQKTRKTLIDYVNDLRIGHARKLLIENDFSIAQVGLEAGFANLSHFHRQFKKSTQLSPMKYQQQYYRGLNFK